MIDHNILSQEGFNGFATECMDLDVRVRIHAHLIKQFGLKQLERVSICDTGMIWKHKNNDCFVYVVRTNVFSDKFEPLDEDVGPWTHHPIYLYIHKEQVFILSPYHGVQRWERVKPNRCALDRYTYINHKRINGWANSLVVNGNYQADDDPDFPWSDGAGAEAWWVDQQRVERTRRPQKEYENDYR